MFFQTIARRRMYALRTHKDMPDSCFLVFVINLLTSLSYREVNYGMGTFDEKIVQYSAGSTGSATSAFGPLSFARPHTVAARGVMVDVSQVRFVSGSAAGVTTG
jgi:hypothetical protein